jgi:transcriptional regulator with XRE-family HTH domain
MTTKGRNPEEDKILRKVAERIKALRIEKGYSNYEKFANEHNIGRSQYGKYEKGENMQLATLLKILKAFDISLSEFFKGFDS